MKKTLWLCAGMATLAVSSVGHAQQIEEIFVTAQKRAESLQDVSVSVDVTTGEAILEQGTSTMEDLSLSLPAVNVSKGGASDQIFIRGIGSGLNGGFEQAVGLYVDGVYMGRSRGGRNMLMDMERVEVLKGPQSLYFGNSSIGGAISVTTAGPGSEFGGDVMLTYTPEIGGRNIEAGVDVPLADNFAVRLALRDQVTDGYVENTGTAVLSEDGAARDDQVYRISASWQPSDTTDVSIKYLDGTADVFQPFVGEVFSCNAGVSAGATAPCPAHLAASLPYDNQLDWRSQSSADDFSTLEFSSLITSVEFDLGWSALTATYGSVEHSNRDLQDLDNGVLEIFNVNQYDSVEQDSYELRLTSLSDGPLQWMVGAYHQSGEVGFDVALSPLFIPPVAGAAPTANDVAASRTIHVQDETTQSIFASLDYDLSDVLTLGLGVRYTQVEKDIDKDVDWGYYPNMQLARESFTTLNTQVHGFARNGTASASLDQSDVLPTVSIEYRGLETGMMYFTYSEGFKAGGFDMSSRNGTVVPDFDQENAKSYEAGFKGTLADGSLRTNISLFKVDYTGVQQSVIDATTFVFNVGNAARSSTQGLEADITWAATDALQFNVNATWLDAQYDDFIGSCNQFQLDTTTCPDDVAAGAQDLSGHPTVFSPDFSGRISADYSAPLSGAWELELNGNLYYTDSYFTQSDFDPNTEVDGYTQLGARVAISNLETGWEFALLGKNLTDEAVPFFCNDLSASAGSYRCSLNEPRTVALQARYSF